MRTDITCALGGIGIQDLDERIYVEDIREEITLNNETGKRPGYGLILLHDPGRDSMDIKVTFHIKEKDWTARMAVLQKVFGWATQGWFTRNHRPGLQIYVVCTKFPQVQTFDRRAKFEITFTAYGEACWQEVTPTVVNVTSAAASATKSITPRGTRNCFLEAEFTPSGGSLASATITVGTQAIALTGLSVASGTTVRMYYDEMHYLRIESAGVSLMDKRTAASSDHIILEPGQANSVSLTFSRKSTYKLTARGLFL
jgi:hypothetical protein